MSRRRQLILDSAALLYLMALVLYALPILFAPAPVPQ